MKFKTFAAFVGPSLALMLVFIAAPLIGVLWQSFHLTQPIFETVEVESCTPGFTGQICTTELKTRPVLDGNGRIVTETTYVGLQSYRNVLEPDRLWEAIASDRWLDILNIDFWAALRFTLTFTLITSDGELASPPSMTTVTVNRTNRPPVVTAPALLTVREGMPVMIN